MNDLRAAAQQALEALTCTGEGDDPGHRCGYCDDYVDRNGPVRAALRAALAEPQTTHWQGCEEVHPECAVAEVERLRRNKKEIADYVRAQYPDREALKTPTKSWGELEKKYQAGCDHCNHPQYCGIRCSVCGRWTQKK